MLSISKCAAIFLQNYSHHLQCCALLCSLSLSRSLVRPLSSFSAAVPVRRLTLASKPKALRFMHTAHTPSTRLSIGWMLNVRVRVRLYDKNAQPHICRLCCCCCCCCHCCYYRCSRACCLNSYHSLLYSVRPVAACLLESSTMCSNECESKCFYSLIRIYIHYGMMYGVA